MVKERLEIPVTSCWWAAASSSFPVRGAASVTVSLVHVGGVDEPPIKAGNRGREEVAEAV